MLLTALASGIAIVVNRFFVLQIDPVLFTAVRSLLIGLLFMAISHKIDGQGKVPLPKLALLGAIGGGLAFLLFFTGLPLTTGGRAAFIHKTLPAWATLLAWLVLGEEVGRRRATALMVALAGLAVMQASSLPVDIRSGDLLALGATVLWAVENTLAKRFMGQGESNWRVTFGRMFFGSLLLFGVAALQGKLALLARLQPVHWLYIGVSTLLLFFYVLTWYWGLRHIDLSKASGLLLLSPVVSLALGWWLLGETVYLLQLAGSLLILAGCWKLARSGVGAGGLA